MRENTPTWDVWNFIEKKKLEVESLSIPISDSNSEWRDSTGCTKKTEQIWNRSQREAKRLKVWSFWLE